MRGIARWTGTWRLTVLMACCVAGLVSLPSVVRGESQSPVTGADTSLSLAGSPLVVQGVQGLDEGQQLEAAEEARRSSPEAVTAREESRTKYESLGAEQAARVAGEAFPAVMDHATGGPPSLPAGQKLVGFADPDAARVDLGGGEGGIIESSVPMATETSSGAYVPVDLDLHDAGEAFEAANPLVAVRMPKHQAEGVQLPGASVSLTQVDSQGAPLGGAEGVSDGATVDYVNTQTDTDTILKPSTLGVDVGALIRSVESPENLYYKVGMPPGAKLVQADNGAGGVQIVKEGVAIAQIDPPMAHDAAGVEVPVGMSVSNDVLGVTVHHRAGSYEYPIFVDPEFWDMWSGVVPGNWQFHETAGFTNTKGNGWLWEQHTGRFVVGDYGEFTEQTQGYTKIYEVYIKVAQWPAEYFEGSTPIFGSYLEIFYPGSEWHAFPVYPFEGGQLTLCSNSSCNAEGVTNNNSARFGTDSEESSQYLEIHGKYQEPFWGAELKEVATAIAQEKGKHSTVSYNTSSETLGGAVNVFRGGGAWLGPASGAFEFEAKDGGLGVAHTKVEYFGTGGWKTYAEHNYESGTACVGLQCAPSEHETYTYEGLTREGRTLSEPESKIRVVASSPVPYSSSAEHGEGEATLKVDTKSPHGITVSGLVEKGGEFELGEVEAHLKAEAMDGEGSIASSGIKSIGVEIDEHEIGTRGGRCVEGPCTASNEWAINGAELGTGAHTLTVVATDNAGNIGTRTYELNVHEASPVAMGPGSVNPESGDFAMEATDVDGSLEVTRHYDSRNPKEGEKGPLGPQWTIGLGSLASLEVLPDKSVMVAGPEGLTHFSLKEGGGFEAPEGDKNLILEYEPKSPAYLLKNPAQGTTIEFTLPTGAELWMPTVSKGPAATDTTTDEYKTVEVKESFGEAKKIVEPVLELAPHPTASCAHKELEKLEITAKSCRALEFKYYEGTTATGEAKAEWGGYKNSLKEVLVVAYNPTTKAMAKTAVAKYEYDQNDHLRTEWNPEISPALQIIYGYDPAGDITAVTSPGHQPWLLHFGVTTEDQNKGRLLSATRSSASTAPWNGKSLSNTVAPTLSTTSPVIGTTIKVATNGTWANGPVAYSYQWEDCRKKGSGENEVICTPIAGAVNQSYTPRARDAGYTLVAQVTAENAGGAQTALTAASNVVPMPAASFSSAFGFGVSNGEAKLQTCTSSCRAGIAGSGSGQFKEPTGDAVDSEGNVWVADTADNRIEKFSSSGAWIGTYAPDSMLAPQAVAFDSANGKIYVSNSGRGRIDELSLSGSLIKAFGEAGSGYGQLNSPDGITFDSYGDVWVADTNNNRLEEFSSGGTYMNRFGSFGSGEGQFSGLLGVAFCNGALYTSDANNNRIEIFSTEGKYESQFGKPGSGNGEFSAPSRIACEPTGNDLYVTDKGNNRVQMFTATGTFIGKFGVAGHEAGQLSTPIGVAVGTTGNVYVVDSANNRIEKWVPTYSTNNPLPEPPSTGSNSVSTVEYGVPLEGAGAPQQMGINPETHKPEEEKWGQADDPVYATSIFPPDEPMGWPAEKYKRAQTYYIDNEARTVNVASPTGGVATSEYNSTNDVTRTLSADNRALSLKEGTKSAEVSDLLDTKNTYAEEGTQLTETLGPQHMVKLVSGKEGKPEETLARSQAHYFYDEGAPEGEMYDLATKTVDDAKTASGAEFDKHTSIKTYSGQKNLGWKLREPTSTTVDPTGLNITNVTEYNETTGNVTETKAPAGSKSGMAYSAQIGSGGEGSGQFNSPKGISLDGKGDVVVADEENARVDIFRENGEAVKSFGSWGTGPGEFLEIRGVATDSKGDIWTVDAGRANLQEFSEKGVYIKTVGSYGAGAGQFEEPKGIAIDSHNNVVIADTGNNRIEKLNEKGEFIAAYGFGVSNGEEKLQTCTSSCRAGNPGTGNGQLEKPRELATDSAGEIWVTDTGNNRVEGFTESGSFIKIIGSLGTGPGQFKEPKGITIDAQGNFFVVDAENDRIEKFNTKGEYKAQFGSEGSENGQFHEPWGIQVNSHGEIFVSDSGNNRIQKLTQGGSEVHNTKTIYYTAKNEATVAACQNHPEWVNLPCQAEPAEQPAGGLYLPVTTTTYNMWDQPEKIEESFNSTKRTKKTTFDNAGRPLTTEETSSIDEPLPTVTDTYNKETGALETQSTTTSGKTKTITSKYNTLGQLIKYTDADSGTTTYLYEEGSDDRLEEVVMAGPEGEAEREKGKQTYSYNTTTGYMEKLVDSTAGTFTAGYDVEGKMTTETYPNGMSAIYTTNTTGQPVGLEYKKTTHCSEHCIWFSDNVKPSIHGETLAQASTLSKENYTYDTSGRLTEVQETPTGKPCTTRLYTYDEESNRTSMTTRQSSNETCPTEGGTTEHHTYDEANRLTDEGITYETFGNTAKLPATDAGQYELTSTYYVDGQVASQTQHEKTLAYGYDPEGRTRETKTTIKGKAEPAIVSHYAAPGDAVAWTSEEGKTWTDDIPGIDGTLSATHSSSGTTELQLHDLKGNIVATASLNEAETKLLKTYNSTEFGVPNEGKEPPKYAWLGAGGITSELPSGTIAKDGITYVPLTGQSLQTQPIDIPQPTNAEPIFTDPQSSWIAETAGEGSAHQIEATREAERALGEEGGGGDGCITTSVCLYSYSPSGVSNYRTQGNNGYGCQIWGSWGHGEFLAGEISGWGHWECGAAVPGFEMQIEAYGWGAPEFEGNEVMLGRPGESHKIIEYWSGGRSGSFGHTWKCPATGGYYHLWFWGRQFGIHGHTQWSASGWEVKIGSCTNQGPVDMTPIGQAGEPQ